MFTVTVPPLPQTCHPFVGKCSRQTSSWKDIQGNPARILNLDWPPSAPTQWTAVKQITSQRVLLVDQDIVKKSTDELLGIAIVSCSTFFRDHADAFGGQLGDGLCVAKTR
jgi:hypothetical protein